MSHLLGIPVAPEIRHEFCNHREFLGLDRPIGWGLSRLLSVLSVSTTPRSLRVFRERWIAFLTGRSQNISCGNGDSFLQAKAIFRACCGCSTRVKITRRGACTRLPGRSLAVRSISFRFSSLMLATSVLIAGCSDPVANNATNQGGSTGGSNPSGGAVGKGGATGSSSMKATGGRTGGTSAAASVKSSGGRTSGKTSSGSATDTGETGGSSSTDATSATGGAAQASTKVATGGTNTLGATSSTDGTKSGTGKGGTAGTVPTSGESKGGSTTIATSTSTGSGSGDGACNAGKWTSTDVTVKGPFETVTENVDGAILYRPKTLVSGCLYPVITWGHGAGGAPSNYTTVLTMMASHGFVVIASTAGNVQDGGSAANQFNNQMVKVADWVVKQNADPTSVLYQKIDTAKIGAAGHSQGGYGASEAGQNPLIDSSVSISGAVGSSNQKGPAFIICGGKDTYSGARCEDHPTASFTGTSGVPVFFGKCLSADHGNWGFEGMLADKTKPHDVVQAMTAWFRYQLMGDEEYRAWFYGADCHLCKHANWSVQRKGME